MKNAAAEFHPSVVKTKF